MRSVNKVISWIENLVVVILGIAIIFLVAAQVVSREVIGSALTWSEETCRLFLVWMVFIGAAIAYRESEHINVTALTDKFSDTTNRVLKTFFEVLILLFTLVITYHGYDLSMKQMVTKFVTIDIPQGVQTMAVPVSGVLLAYHILYRLGSSLMAHISNKKEAMG